MSGTRSTYSYVVKRFLHFRHLRRRLTLEPFAEERESMTLSFLFPQYGQRILFFPAQRPDPDFSFLQEFLGHPVGVIPSYDDLSYPGIYDHLGADDAGLRGRIEYRAPETRPVQGRLKERVLLAVQASAELVPLTRWYTKFLANTSYGGAMLYHRRRAVISGGKYPLVLHNYRADPAP